MDLSIYEVLVLSFGAAGLGCLLLAKGGAWTVEGAVVVAERFGLSKMSIGFTIVAIGTSLPELVVSLGAHLGGKPDVALGNVVGSNVANLLLILSATALIWPVVAQRRAMAPDMAMMAVATLGLTGLLLWGGGIARWQGAVMLLVLVTYIAAQVKLNRDRAAALLEEVEEAEQAVSGSPSLVLLGGLVAVAAGAELLVQGAVTAAGVIGVPDAVVGLTIVALGTSLPELATCVAAARKRHTEMVLGNVIGSNVFNILFILGATASVKAIPMALGAADLLTMVAITFAAGIWLMVTGKAGRIFGAVALAAYAVFIGWQYTVPLIAGGMAG